jgi:Spy/CpxP family protein refolding chaperone
MIKRLLVTALLLAAFVPATAAVAAAALSSPSHAVVAGDETDGQRGDMY